MGWFRRQTRRVQDAREQDPAVVAHLRHFAASRTDVEAWIEEPTSFNPASVLLVAWDGEWTRRRVPSVQWARDFCSREGLRSYPAGVVPYPQRMRDFDQRRKLRGQADPG